MTQEQKEILLRDLSSRLPYGTIVGCNDDDGTLPNIWDVAYINIFTEDLYLLNTKTNATQLISVEDVKPYLFPLSSMTEEQEKEFSDLYYRYHESAFIFNERYSYDRYSIKDIGFYPYYLQDWFNANHFDYRGLIEKGLAIDATNLNIY